MFPTLSTALTALTADQMAISVTGNNLANLNTTGFKAGQAQFSDLMSEAMGVGAGSQIGMGVAPIQTTTVYTQGAITTTNAPLDAAVQGNGFFVVQDPSSNQQLYTRDGSFQLNADGQLETSTGQLVQGWSATNGVVNSNNPIGDITIPTGTVIPAVATQNMSAAINLNAQSPVGTTYSTPIQIYDSLGTPLTATVSFQETAPGAWTYAVNMPNSDFTAAPGVPLATGTLNFDGNGNLVNPAAAAGPVPIAIGGLADGANNMTVNWNLFDSNGNPLVTQYAQASGTGSETQDGSGAGQVTQVALGNGGLITATYSNGETATVGQLALAAISNPQSLVSVGNNNLE